MEKDEFLPNKSKEGGNVVFDGTENDGVDNGFNANGRVFDTKKRLKGNSRAEYRRVGKYFKSSEKYWQERKRRKLVAELLEQNLTIKDIAVKLGVSERTVKRDIAKIQPYYERRVRHYLRCMEQNQQAEFEAAFKNSSPKNQLKMLRARLKTTKYQIKLEKQQEEMLKRRDYLRHQLLVTIDLDDLSSGYPKIMHTPQMPLVIKYPFEINFAFKKNGETKQVQGLLIKDQT